MGRPIFIIPGAAEAPEQPIRETGTVLEENKNHPLFCKEAVLFIVNSCLPCVFRKNFRVTKNYPVISSGLTCHRLRGDSVEATMLRFEMMEQLCKLVTKVFGLTSRLGVPVHCQRVGLKDGVAISENTAINVVEGLDNMEAPVPVRTQRDGVDLVFMKDGYVGISVRYRLFLFRYNSSGMPMDCTCPDLMDLLLHFPNKQEIPDNSDDGSSSSHFPDNDSVIDLEDDNNIAAMKEKWDHQSVNTIESSSNEWSKVIPTQTKRRCIVTGTCVTFFLSIGTCFRFSKHDSV